MKRHKTFYIDRISKINFCGENLYHYEGSDYLSPYDIKPTKGEHSYDTCKSCNKLKVQLIEELKEQASIFPNCCDEHKKLYMLKEFNKVNFQNLEENIADKIIYTHHHIINRIDTGDWYDDIIEYFEYVLESFGSFPTGFGAGYLVSNYIDYTQRLLKSNLSGLKSDLIKTSEIDIRLKKIIEYIELRISDTKPKKKSELNILLNKYDEWYRTFPFDISYFKHLKDKFKKTIPILTDEVKTNRYSGKRLVKLTTKENLTQNLIKTTSDIISNINGLKLYEKGVLSNTENIKLELILKNRELQLSETASMDNTDRNGYIQVLKKWFKEEKKFIKDIKPFLDNEIKKPITNTNFDNPKWFKDLFDSEELYNKAINVLVDNKFISNDGTKLKWVFLETKEYKTKQTIIALCVVLITKHYFKNSPIAIYDNLKNEFNISIHKSTFSRSSDGFKRDYDKKGTTGYNYISLFKDIL